MGITGGITGGGPPKPKPPPMPMAAPIPATANAPSIPVAPAATSPIAEVPSGVTTPACSPNSSVTSPVGFEQLIVWIFPFGSTIAVLTSPFPLGGVQHRWLRPSAVGGLLQFSASMEVPAVLLAISIMFVSALVPYAPGFANGTPPTAPAQHVAVPMA